MDRRQFITVSALGTAGVFLGGLRGVAQQVGAAEYTFVAIADPHLREDREGEATGVDKFRALLAKLQQEAPEAEFGLVLGDIHPEKLEELLPEIALPLHVVHGNHENRTHREMLREMFPEDFEGRDYYAFERGDDLFIALCTAIPGDHVGHFQSQHITPSTGQLAWLQELLSGRGNWRHVFVYGHIPPEEQNGANSMTLAQNDSRWLHELVAESRPTALFFGHRHRQMDFEIAGVPVHGVRSVNWNSGGEPVGALVVHVEGERVESRFVPTH
ncbi:MAG: metallophosphoesterase family protein [Armatimonadota bacterium]|jgi:predicted phosphodiesterase